MYKPISTKKIVTKKEILTDSPRNIQPNIAAKNGVRKPAKERNVAV